MPSGKDGTTMITFLKRELEASLVKIASLEKENHELKQETSRLKSQIITLKAHDLERKSMLWKKLQNSMDCGKLIEEPPPKHKLVQLDHAHHDNNNNNNNATTPIKKTTSNHNNCIETTTTTTTTALPKKLPPVPPPSPPQRRVIAPPPPPPPLPASTPVGSKQAVRRVPAVMEFYRSLMKIESSKKDSKKGSHQEVTCSRDMIGEIENRSTYLTSIKSDVEKYGERVNILIREVERAGFREISEVEAFVKWIDGELSCLVDERGVLKHFPHWPERKADALREAAFTYRDLMNLQSQVLAFDFSNTTTNQHYLPSSSSFIQSLQALQDRVESSISGVERTREGTSKKYKELQIPWQWLMDTGIVGQIKLTSLKLARECMTRISKDIKCNMDASRDADLLLQGVRFAFRVHQFAGGFDTETMHAFEELKNIGSGIYNN